MGTTRRELLAGTALALGAPASAAPSQSVEAEIRATAKLLDSERAAARKAGIPLETADLKLPTVPAEQDAGPIYGELAELERRLPRAERDAGSDLLAAAVRKVNTPDERKRAAELLIKWAPLLELARKAASKPHKRCTLEWERAPDVSFAPWGIIRLAARLLSAAAVLSEDCDESRSFLQLASQVAGHAYEEPTAISGLVAMAIEAYADTAFDRLGRRHAADTGELQKLIDLHSKVARVPDVHFILRGESLFGVCACRRPHRMLTAEREIVDARSDHDKQLDPKLLRLPEPVLSAAFEVRHLQVCRRVFEVLSKSADYGSALPELERVSKEEQIQQAPSHRLSHDAFVFYSLPAAATRTVARQRLRSAFLAVLAEHSAAGDYPDRLENAPVDPFNGKPLRYRKLATGFSLHSVGLNRKDDAGGTSSDEDGQPRDIVLQYP